jgi:epoxyqueuosine reductase QueG
MEFEDKARSIIEKECEDYFLGIVDLSSAQYPDIGQYNSLFNDYPRAISIGITQPMIFDDELLDGSKSAHNTSDWQLNIITAHLINLLEKEGYKAFSVPKARNVKDNNFTSLHIMAAYEADLGIIENNGMLITPEVGSAVNWGTVLTDAPIKLE